MLDTWLRQRLVPSLPEGVRLVLSGREPPVAAWFTAESLDGRIIVLDFGPRSVDGWLAGLVAAELGLMPWVLDKAGHELRVDDRRVVLTPLEFGVLDKLCRVPGRTVSRRELLEDVWGWPSSGGSNVVDAVVRRLRKKLADRPAIETVRAAGYRLREDWLWGNVA